MTVMVIAKAEVIDFSEWKTMFDSIEQQRQQIGINFKAYQNEKNPNTSYFMGTVQLKTVFQDFFNSPERQAIQKTVMVAPPEITSLMEC